MVAGGTARAARTKLHSQAKKPGTLHSEELSTLQLVRRSVLGAENRESGSSPPWGFGDRKVHSVMIIQGDTCSN